MASACGRWRCLPARDCPGRTEDAGKAANQAISIILFKLEGQLIARHPGISVWRSRRLLDLRWTMNSACIALERP